MEGGPGNDTYLVDDPGDAVVEAQDSGNPDTVVASVSFAQPDFFDELVLDGIGDIDGTGNNGANRIAANLGNNTLAGRGDRDEFVFFSATGADRILDFADGEDRIAILSPGVRGVGDLSIASVGGNAVVAWSIDGIASQVTLVGVDPALLSAADFAFS
jgi:Ca2+-binding RTX toxin-like protein